MLLKAFMFVSLVKIKKYLIYLFLFLLFNCFFTLPIKAGGTSFVVEYEVDTINNANLLRGIAFNTDGSKMFVTTATSDRIEQFTLSVPFDLSSTLTRGTPLLDSDRGKVINPYSLQFNTDGTKMFFAQFGGDLFEFSLSTPFDISPSSAAANGDAVNKTLSNGNTTGFVFNADGTKLFVVDNNYNNSEPSQVDQYILTTGFDISTISHETSLDITDNTPKPRSIALSPDGTTMFILDGTNQIDEYVLTTGNDVTTAKYVDTFTFSNTTQPWAITFNNIGTKLYIAENKDGGVNEYSLGAAYNLTTPTLSSSVPADNATGVLIDANIILNFSEPMDVESGNIKIYKTSDNSLVETIDVTSSQVTGTGTTAITINPSSDFEYNVEYYVLIDATAFDDGSDASYAGITSTTALSFTVSDDRLDPTTIKDVIGSIDAQSELAKNYISQSIDTVSNRLRFLRQNRLSDSLSSQGLQLDIDNTILASLANDNIEKNANSIMPNTWSAWTSGSAYVSKIGDSINSSSQETEGQAVALGFDKKLSDSDFIGFAIQYGESDTDIGTNGTSVDSENMNFSVYRTRPLDNNNFIETLLGIGLIESDLKRVHNSSVLTGTRDGTQIFGSINYGKTIDRGDFNITPIGRLDIGYTKLDDYKETGINALYYASQRIESGLASFGFEVSDNIQFNENKFQPFGSLKVITDFSNKSDAKINYVTDTSTIYTYTQKANSNHLISSMIGLTYTAGDYLNINSSYSRVQGNRSERRDTIDFAINFISNRETQYSLSLAGDENAEAKLGISKNIYGFYLGFNANQSISNNSNQEAELMLTYNF